MQYSDDQQLLDKLTSWRRSLVQTQESTQESNESMTMLIVRSQEHLEAMFLDIKRGQDDRRRTSVMWPSFGPQERTSERRSSI
jgi:hypothetical protein